MRADERRARAPLVWIRSRGRLSGGRAGAERRSAPQPSLEILPLASSNGVSSPTRRPVDNGNEDGQLTNLLRQFGSSLLAFTQDLGDRMEDVVLVTMTEFGRTVAENGNAGTDHGHGNVMMILGGGVRGGRLYGEWPGLEPEQLFERRDLAVTTDFRDVLGELVSGHLGQKVDQVFPGYAPKTSLGLLTSSG